jgi:DNA-directed RNA polymerase specialized sigma24 family protein
LGEFVSQRSPRIIDHAADPWQDKQMSFPQTRHTLIQRIASAGEERDWGEFLADYWGPICRFARRGGALSADDAEDAAAQTFEVLVRNRLLGQWVAARSAKLRTLLCAVVRNVLANRARVLAGRARLARDHGGRLDDRDALPLVTSLDAPAEQVDAFHAAWVEELLQQAVEALLDRYYKEGKGDHFRILYGRLCEAMTTPEIAAALGLTASQAENAFKHARKALTRGLEDLVRDHVRRYCAPEDVENEFAAEWGQLGDYLKKHGGLEEAVRRAHENRDPMSRKKKTASVKSAVLTRMSEFLRGDESPGR